jgi:hypothetical protein
MTSADHTSADAIDGLVLRPGDPDFAAHCTAFNLLAVHTRR